MIDQKTKISCVMFLICFIIFYTLDEATAQPGTKYGIKQSVIAQGGTASQSTNYEVGDVIGQASPVGSTTSTNFTISAGFLGGGVSLISAVGEMDKPAIPAEYKLHQNYPNPFNPTTTISFSLPKTSKVSLIIYNLAGQEVTALANENQPAGHYEIKWNAGDLPSGVYICKMQSGEFIQTRKLILLK